MDTLKSLSEDDTTLLHLKVKDLPFLFLGLCLGIVLLRVVPAAFGRSGKKIRANSGTSSSLFTRPRDDLTSRFTPRAISEGAFYVSLKMVPFCSFPPTVGASMAVDNTATHNAFIFGGERQVGLSDDMLIFSQKDNDWTWQSSQGETPGKLAYSSMVDVPGYLLLYGGVGPGDHLNGLVFALDLATGDWQRCVVEGEEKPVARYGASLVRWGQEDDKDMSCCVLYGGMNQRSILLNDAWLLEKMAAKSEGRPVVRWRPLLPDGGSGVKPLGRKLHSSVLVGDDMVVLGGLASERLPHGMVEVLEVSTGRWRSELTMGSSPSVDDEEGEVARAFRIGPSKQIMYISPLSAGIFNELCVLDMTKKPWTWSTAVAEWKGDWAQVPGARRLYAAAVDVSTGDILVFGGENSEHRQQGHFLILSAGEALVH